MKVIQFLKYGKYLVIVSLLAVLAGFGVTVSHGGFNLGLDFQAGISQRVSINPGEVRAPIDQVRTALREIDGAQIQTFGDPINQEYGIKVKQEGSEKTFAEEMARKITQALEGAFGAGNVQLLQTEYVGPRFSADLASQAAFLTIFAMFLILLYSWFRFKLEYAVAAILALIHDALFMIAFIGAFQLEVTTATVAAVLTIIGYSINDTIVIFDRIRENNGLMRESPFPVIINTSLTQSMSRTTITSLTTLLAVAAIFIFATGDVRLFALNMIVGIVVGTYSSVFISTYILHSWNLAARKRRAKKAGRDPEAAVRAAKGEKEAIPAPELLPAQTQEAQPAPMAEEGDTPAMPAPSADAQVARKKSGKARMSRQQRKRRAKKS